MVERLTAALERARFSRAEAAPDAALSPGQDVSLPASTAIDWMDVPEAALDPADLDDARIVDPARDSRPAASLEILRTRLTGICRQNGWKRIAFVPTKSGCGATTLALNLAMTTARKGGTRVLLADLDSTSPTIAQRLDIARGVPVPDVPGFLCPPETEPSRLGENLVLMTGKAHARNSSSLIPGQGIRGLLRHLQSRLQPDLVFLDLPPVFSGGDAMALLGEADAAFQIAMANRTTAPEIDECAEAIAGSTAYLGVILNQCADRRQRRLTDVAG